MPALSPFKHSPSVRSIRRLATVTVTLIALLLAATFAPKPALAGDASMARVIVQLWDANDLVARDAVKLLGGTITAELPIVGGFAATLPESNVATLIATTGIRVVTPDAPVWVQDTMPDGGTASVHKDVINSTTSNAAGHRGAGVNVAVIDTGIADVAGFGDRLMTLDTPAGPAKCVNFSTELGCTDSFGHGTFVASMVHDVAPDAGLIALKLSGRDGYADVSRLLKSLEWVLAHKDTYAIKVVNLSIRTYSPLSYRVDPVNLAVQRVWAAGVAVVVSSGNQGPDEGTITKPADDPWVITVGSTDDQGTVTLDDDAVSSFSARGPSIPDAVVKPDVVVPGRSLVGLRSPGSAADELYPYFVSDTHRRGSGTSFSAPLVAGAAAVLMAADPSATNDRVKFALAAAGRPISGATAGAQGAGTFDLEAARVAPAGVANANGFHPLFWQAGTAGYEDVAGSVFELQWASGLVCGCDWEATDWEGANWQGANWQGANWQGANWQGANWQGANWQGANWQGANWQGANWQGANWQSEYWS